MGAKKLRRKQFCNLASKARTTNSHELDRLYDRSDDHTDCTTNCHSFNSQVWSSKESTTKCHCCGIVGHYANNCTHKAHRSVNYLEHYSRSDASFILLTRNFKRAGVRGIDQPPFTITTDPLPPY